MLRKGFLAGMGSLAALVILMAVPTQAAAWWGCNVNRPYVSGCRSGHCDGGDYYIGGRSCCGNCNRNYGGIGMAAPAPTCNITPTITRPVLTGNASSK